MFVTKYVAFVGDSFCADYEVGPRSPYKQVDTEFVQQSSLHQGFADRGPCWTTELATMLERRVLPFGYGGMNWWHSKWHFEQYYRGLGDTQQDVDIIIYCHTAHGRPLARNTQGLSGQDLDSIAKQGWCYYYDNIFDEEFAHWARAQYFLEISRLYPHKQLVHLSCFDPCPEDVSGWSSLPGVRFSQPLIWIQVAELMGTKTAINTQMTSSNSRNHLSQHNNVELARQIYQALDKKLVGPVDFDFSRFQLLNPNYRQWPHGDFGC